MATCALAVFEYIIRADPHFAESSHTAFVAMLIFSLPTSLVTAAACAFVEGMYESATIWLEFGVAILVGYIQWGVIVPHLLDRCGRPPRNESECNPRP